MTYTKVSTAYVAENAGNVTLIDVRTPAEFAEGHIPHAVNVPLDEAVRSGEPAEALADALEEQGVAPTDEVVVYCHSGIRARSACEYLVQAGFTNVKLYAGSMVAWEKAQASAREFPDTIPGFPEFGHIPFEKLANTRDLGGLPAADGRRVKPALLLRSGALHKAHEADIVRLLNDYALEGVFDFRTSFEREKNPDPRELMPGVVFYDLPVVQESAVGITHAQGLAADIAELSHLKQEAAKAHETVKSLYAQMLVSDAGRLAYGSFLQVLLEGNGGAYLWHCSEGKDRAGLAAVVLEQALGVPDAYVKDDYLATNLFVQGHAEKLLDELGEHLHLMKGLDGDVDSIFYAYSDYFEAAMQSVAQKYGTFADYLEKGLDFGPKKQEALREKYLR